MPKIYISPQQKIAYLFLTLTSLTIIGTIFGFFNLLYKAEIIITPKAQEIDTNFTTQIKENPNNEELTTNIKVLTGKFAETIEEGEFNQRKEVLESKLIFRESCRKINKIKI